MTDPRRRPCPSTSSATGARWDEWAPDYVANGEVSWRLGPGDEKWGVWDIPERELRLLPDDLDRQGHDRARLRDRVRLGVARPARRPAGRRSTTRSSSSRPPGASRPSTASTSRWSTATPRRCRIPDASFDLAISEYGASIWADPHAWIPEAARLLRPGGRLIFLINATLLMLCMPDEERPATERAAPPAARAPPARVVERRVGQLRPRPRRLDPGPAERAGSRSSDWSSSGRPRTRRRPSRT